MTSLSTRKSVKQPSSTRAAKKEVARVGDFMTASPHSIGFDQPLSIAHALMRDYRVRHLPVLKRGRLVGVLSQRDLYFLESITGVDVQLDQVEEGMTRDLYTVSEDTPLKEVVQAMAKQRYGCALVTRESKLVGIFTTTNALKMLATSL
jgi:acetoin utilization protein AcuB